MIEVYIVYHNNSTLKEIGRSNLKDSPFFHLIDERKDKKKAWKVKGAFSAKMNPFVVIYDGERPMRAFYSETGEDVIESLITYLNED